MKKTPSPVGLGRAKAQSDVLAQAQLRGLALRVTQARLDVLSLLLRTPRAMSHLEMQEHLPAMDRVTLYRALDCLAQAGLAHKITGDDRVFRFSVGNEPEVARASTRASRGGVQHQHGHFQCTRCAQVFCLDQPEAKHTLKDQLKTTLAATSLRGFQNHDIEVTIKGWCHRCAD